MTIAPNQTARADDFIQNADKNATPANDEGRVAKLEADARIHRNFLPLKFGGDGSDGALTVSSGTVDIDLGGAAVVVKNYTTIAITGTGKVTFSNPNANGTTVIFKSQGAVTLTSSEAPMIDASGLGANGGAGGVRSSGSSSGNTPGSNGLNGISPFDEYYTNGGVGATTGTGGALPTLGAFKFYVTLLKKYGYPFHMIPSAGGGGGFASKVSGDSSSATGGTGGKAGGFFMIECAGAWNFTTAGGISVAGKNATNGTQSGSNTAATGAGGGGGGTFVALYNELIANTGTVTVSGGLGSSGASGFGGTAVGGGGGASMTEAGDSGVDVSYVSKNGGDGADGVSYVIENTEFS